MSRRWTDPPEHPSDWLVGYQEFTPKYTARQIADGDDLEPEGVSTLAEVMQELMPGLIASQREAIFDIDLTKVRWV